ncbi:ANTAR domain-containing protein [Mycolicibacterium lacusdiani]|uniref:ANTAR domain-containing protein n=1 Tax=Mycolicibacterium lacusdiani TaxID=2895283 RepID=UPI001F1A6EC6|nr:ANTAR domain-containing protein [Mycolicibacterium lacusdiani]
MNVAVEHAFPGRAQRDGRRRLCAAEGVLVALRRYTLDEAFVDIVMTSRLHNVAPLRLADALVALAQGDGIDEGNQKAVDVARKTWGDVIDL